MLALAQIAERSAERTKTWRIAALLWLVSAALLLAVNQYRNGPAVLADELGYLGVARWLAGAASLPNMFTASFYHFGYSILIVPAFWLGHDPISAYKWVMVINCLMAACVAPLVYAFSRRVLLADRKPAFWAALLATLYPAVAVQTNSAWTENLLTPLFLCWVMLLAAACREPKFHRLACLALIAPVLYLVHPRMLGVEGITFIYLLLGTAVSTGRRSIHLMAGILLLAAHSAVTGALRYVRHAAYETSSGSIGELRHQLHRLPELLQRIPAAASGELLYLSYGSCALILVGFTGLCLIALRRHGSLSNDHSLGATLLLNPLVWVLLATLSLFGVSAIFMASGSRLDHWLYGRYVDVVSPMLVATGILVAGDHRKIRQIATWLVPALLLAMLLWICYSVISSPALVYSNIPTLAPLVYALARLHGLPGVDLSAAMLLIIAPALLFAACGKRALLPLLVFYVCGSVVAIQAWVDHIGGHDAYPAAVRQVRTELAREQKSQVTVFVSRKAFGDAAFIPLFYRAQFYLDQNRFVVVNDDSPHPGCAFMRPSDGRTHSAGLIQLTPKTAFGIYAGTPSSGTCH